MREKSGVVGLSAPKFRDGTPGRAGKGVPGGRRRRGRDKPRPLLRTEVPVRRTRGGLHPLPTTAADLKALRAHSAAGFSPTLPGRNILMSNRNRRVGLS